MSLLAENRALRKTVMPRRPRRRWAAAFALLYYAVLAAISTANASGPEKWWPSALNLYLPQWIWALPAFGLVCVPRLGWPSLLVAGPAALWVAGPLMGYCWHSPAAPAGLRLRLMTYNIKWGERDLGAIVGQIRELNPDVILMQDANASPSVLGVLHYALGGWHTVTTGQYIIASRAPITDVSTPSIAVPGGDFAYVRCRTVLRGRQITLYDVHLFTPREGLTAFRADAVSGSRAFEANVADRLYQAGKVATSAAEEPGPLIVAGDLNAPVQSVVCRGMDRAGLTDAFSAAGRGYGYTYGGFPNPNSAFLRIDHVYTSRHWAAVRCWTGNARGSWHRPVICDLLLTPSAGAH